MHRLGGPQTKIAREPHGPLAIGARRTKVLSRRPEGRSPASSAGRAGAASSSDRPLHRLRLRSRLDTRIIAGWLQPVNRDRVKCRKLGGRSSAAVRGDAKSPANLAAHRRFARDGPADIPHVPGGTHLRNEAEGAGAASPRVRPLHRLCSGPRLSTGIIAAAARPVNRDRVKLHKKTRAAWLTRPRGARRRRRPVQRMLLRPSAARR